MTVTCGFDSIHPSAYKNEIFGFAEMINAAPATAEPQVSPTLSSYNAGSVADKTLGWQQRFCRQRFRHCMKTGGGKLWLGSGGCGVYLLQTGKFHFYTQKDGLSQNQVTVIFQDHLGNFWIGGRDSGLNRLAEGRVTIYTEKNGLSSDSITAITKDKTGMLWVGTARGLNWFEKGDFKHFSPADDLFRAAISVILSGRDGKLWIGTLGRGLHLLSKGKTVVFNTSTGLADDFVLSLIEDAVGNVWIGTQNGLNCLGKNGIKVYGARNGLACEMIQDMYIDARVFFGWLPLAGESSALKKGFSVRLGPIPAWKTWRFIESWKITCKTCG